MDYCWTAGMARFMASARCAHPHCSASWPAAGPVLPGVKPLVTHTWPAAVSSAACHSKEPARPAQPGCGPSSPPVLAPVPLAPLVRCTFSGQAAPAAPKLNAPTVELPPLLSLPCLAHTCSCAPSRAHPPACLPACSHARPPKLPVMHTNPRPPLERPALPTAVPSSPVG